MGRSSTQRVGVDHLSGPADVRTSHDHFTRRSPETGSCGRPRSAHLCLPVFTQKIGVDAPAGAADVRCGTTKPAARLRRTGRLEGFRRHALPDLHAEVRVCASSSGCHSRPTRTTTTSRRSPATGSWAGSDGTHEQVFTQGSASNPPPVPLTSDAHSHDLPQVSGDRVVWRGNGRHGQPDLPGQAHHHAYPSPLAERVEFDIQRKKGVRALHALGQPGKRCGRHVHGRGAGLPADERPNAPTKWKNSYALSTNGAGVVSIAFSSHKAGPLIPLGRARARATTRRSRRSRSPGQVGEVRPAHGAERRADEKTEAARGRLPGRWIVLVGHG